MKIAKVFHDHLLSVFIPLITVRRSSQPARLL